MSDRNFVSLETAIDQLIGRGPREVEFLGHPIGAKNPQDLFCVCGAAEGCPCVELVRLPISVVIEPIGIPSDDGVELFRVRLPAATRLDTLQVSSTTAGELRRRIDSGFKVGEPDQGQHATTLDLTIADHTNAVKELLDNSLELAQVAMKTTIKYPGRTNHVLVAELIELSSISKSAKMAIASASSAVNGFETAPRNAFKVALGVAQEIGAETSFEGMIKKLERLRKDKDVRSIPELERGVGTTLEILSEGADTIYNPDFHDEIAVYSKTKSTAEQAEDLAKADAVGAVLGSIVPGGGTVAGAVTASTGKAVVAVVDQVWDWLF